MATAVVSCCGGIAWRLWSKIACNAFTLSKEPWTSTWRCRMLNQYSTEFSQEA